MQYDDLSREQIISLLVKRDAQRKLGLVWERDEIQGDRAANGDFVLMDYDREASCSQPPYQNLAIEADNFDALRWLRMTYAGRVKAIYIDPPYNTGNKDWVYNDRYRRREDRYPDSTWLEFLFQRLSIARDLLRPDGVILVSINDEQRAKIELLMDDVFSGMRIGTFAWKRRMGTGDEAGRNYSADHEHVLVYGGPAFKFRGAERDVTKYQPGAEGERPWADITLSKNATFRTRPNAFFPIENTATGVWYPCNPNRVWGCVREETGGRSDTTLERLRERDLLIFKDPENFQVFDTKEALLAAIEDGTAHRYLRADQPSIDDWVGRKIGMGAVRLKRYLDYQEGDTKPVSSWFAELGKARKKKEDDTDGDWSLELASGLNGEATSLLQQILGDRVFDYAKPLSLIEALLGQCSEKDDIVLDFFAGSGTAAHAVLRLNKADGGQRRFIMVSSTEATEDNPGRNLCRDVCAERVRRVVHGYEYRAKKGKVAVPGIGGDFAYLAAIRIPFEDISYEFSAHRAWLTVQAMHGLPFTPAEPDRPIQSAVTQEGVVIAYCDRLSEDGAQAVETLLSQDRLVIAYAYTPGPLRDAFSADNRIEVRSLLDECLRRFRA